MRINKFLSKNDLGSRRKCEELIKNRLIKVNGKIIDDFSYNVSQSDVVQYKNKLLNNSFEYFYYLLHKPRGYICSYSDPLSRKTIYELLPNQNRLFSIGRLDYDTSGIILITNDGEFSNFLSHPKNLISKNYYVSTDKKLRNIEILKIKQGIHIDSKQKYSGKFKFIEYCNSKYIWNVELKEGKNKEIKKIFKYFNINVRSIHRYKYSDLELGKLKEGKYRILKRIEINVIKKKYNYK